MTEEDGRAIVEMAWTLIGLEPDARELVAPLRKAVRHHEPEVRFSAALALDGDVPDAEIFPAFLAAYPGRAMDREAIDGGGHVAGRSARALA